MDETKHFKMVGTTGTGKSTAIRELLTGALDRGDRCVIADADGGYLQRFYDPGRGDIILNPFDPRAARWDLFSEIILPHVADQLARSFIPDQEFASRLIGKREIVRQQHSTSRSTDHFFRKTHTVSEHVVVEDAVMASEIEQLADLSGFLKLVSQPHWQRATLSNR